MTLQERLLAGVADTPAEGCWNWIKEVRCGSRPYGRLTIGSRSAGDRRKVSAHRLSYKVFVGPIGDDLCVCHHCDNPRCINPAHLFLGTKKDNADDRDRKGRNLLPPVARGERHLQSKLMDADVSAIRFSSLSSREIAKIYGVSDSYIRQLRRNKWRVPVPPAPVTK